MIENMDKAEIANELRNRSNNKNVRLPRDIEIELANSILTMKVEKPCCNMQTNSCSFEGWILTLYRWLTINANVSQVKLDWSDPNLDLGAADNGRLHYNRFLYRVHMFSKMYGWFDLVDGKKKEIESFISWLTADTKCLLNVPKGDPKDRSATNIDSECYIESIFATTYEDLLKKKTDVTNIYNQLPVGLFRNSVAKPNAVFTGKKSAIDLWGPNENTKTLCVYELKYRNVMVGVISELFFYLMILNGACSKDAWLQFDSFKDNKRGISELMKVPFSQLKGYILADSIHPLIDREVIGLFNTGLARIGAIEVDTLLYDYVGGVLNWRP